MRVECIHARVGGRWWRAGTPGHHPPRHRKRTQGRHDGPREGDRPRLRGEVLDADVALRPLVLQLERQRRRQGVVEHRHQALQRGDGQQHAVPLLHACRKCARKRRGSERKSTAAGDRGRGPVRHPAAPSGVNQAQAPPPAGRARVLTLHLARLPRERRRLRQVGARSELGVPVHLHRAPVVALGERHLGERRHACAVNRACACRELSCSISRCTRAASAVRRRALFTSLQRIDHPRDHKHSLGGMTPR